MANRSRWLSTVALAFILVLVSAGTHHLARAAGPTPLHLPLVGKNFSPPSGTIVRVSGRVLLEGRHDHSGATLKVNGVPVAQTDSEGRFNFSWRLETPASRTFTVTAHCPAYLWAQTELTVDRSTVFALPDVCLLGGDVQGPMTTTVTPPEGCPSQEPVVVNGPPDGLIDLLDMTLVWQELDVNDTDPRWGPDPCYPGVPYLGYRADINGDGQVDGEDMAIVTRNSGLSAPIPWVPCAPSGGQIVPPSSGARKAGT